MRIYLDACCLNRPFDDLIVDRNRLEAEAVLTILRRVERGAYEWIGSEALDLELELNPNVMKRDAVRPLLKAQSRSVIVGDAEDARTRELSRLGLPVMDALHVACAESSGCDVLLTTDDRMIRWVRTHGPLRTVVMNPLRWIQEQVQDEHH
jgi:predicted nucleic acid-binding protein